MFQDGSRKESFDLFKPAGQVRTHAPRAMLQCSAMRRIAAHGS